MTTSPQHVSDGNASDTSRGNQGDLGVIIFNSAWNDDMPVNQALVDTLMDMTPPLDEEEELRLSQSIEAAARIELENEGCPPCYPPTLNVSIQEAPPKYREIVGYWKSFLSTEDVVLRAQADDWKKFREHQAVDRYRYQKHFDLLTAEVHGRLRSHGVKKRFTLRQNQEEQSPRENWLEFHHYHLYRLEVMESKRNKLREKLSNVPENQVPPPPIQRPTPLGYIAGRHFFPPIQPASERDAISRNLRAAERDLKRQAILLHWISTTPPPPPKTHTSKRASRSCRMTRNATSETDTQQLRSVNKSSPSSTSRLRRKKRAVQKLGADKREVSATTAARLPKLTSQLTTDKTAAQSSQLARVGNKRKRNDMHGQRHVRTQPEQSPLPIKTRCGRISKPPVRLGFS